MLEIALRDCSVVAASRTTYKNDRFEGETQVLKPVSLDLEILRNLSSNWYHNIPDIEITAHLKPITVSSTEWKLVKKICGFKFGFV